MSPSRPSCAAAAACLTAALAAAQDDDLRARIVGVLDLARPALLAHLDQACQPSTRPGELALLTLAALHDGVPDDEPVLQRAIERLARARPNQTYDVALRLCVLEACPSFPDRAELAAHDARTLLLHRAREGTFQYMKRPSAWDLSNTQYGALGLRAAAAVGVDLERSVWSRLAEEVAAQQDPHGGFGYTQRHSGFDSYASMTAAGLAVLAICRQNLGDGPAAKRLDAPIAKGWAWFATNRHAIGSPKERWSYYFHYGLERAAILCDVERIGGDLDWYATGARMLVEEQLAGGGWRSHTDGYPGGHLDRKRGAAVPTAFAVLFLRRKFQKLPGPITPHVVTMVNIGPWSKDKDVEACAAELIRRGKAAMHDIVKGLRSDVEPQRRAAAKALHGIAGDTFGYDPARVPADNRTAVHAAELWYLRNR